MVGRSSPKRQTAVLGNSSRLSMRRPARATLVTMSPRVRLNSHLGSAAFSAPAKWRQPVERWGFPVEVVADDFYRAVADLDVGHLGVFLVQD